MARLNGSDRLAFVLHRIGFVAFAAIGFWVWVGLWFLDFSDSQMCCQWVYELQVSASAFEFGKPLAGSRIMSPVNCPGDRAGG